MEGVLGWFSPNHSFYSITDWIVVGNNFYSRHTCACKYSNAIRRTLHVTSIHMHAVVHMYIVLMFIGVHKMHGWVHYGNSLWFVWGCIDKNNAMVLNVDCMNQVTNVVDL